MKIVTHNAKFHADDVFGVAALSLLYPDAEIIRTRDKEIIESADIVLDVGEIYNQSTNRFDHHQAGGAGNRENGIPYASFGLIWKKFGKEITGSEVVAERIDRSVAQPIDAPDNGVDIVSSKFPGIFSANIGMVVDNYRGTWKEEVDWDEQFKECVKWAKSFLERRIKIEQDVFEGEEIVRKTYQESKDKSFIVVSEEYDFGRELVNGVLVDYPEPLYAVLYRHDHKNWQLVAIRKNHESFDLRKRLPKEWGAKHFEELENLTGVKGSLFCHRGGFMCTTTTKEAAIKLAEIALNS